MWSSINAINLYTIADTSRNYAKLGILWFADYSKMLEMPLPTYLWGETDGELLFGVTHLLNMYMDCHLKKKRR